MELYLLSRIDEVDYDEYDSAVVAAESEEESKNIEVGHIGQYHSSWTTPDNIKVELIGTAREGTKAGVILTSYNAG